MQKSSEEHNVQQEKRRSLIITFLNRFAAFIYSLFAETWIGRKIAGNDKIYESSYVGKFLSGDKKLSDKARTRKRRISEVLEDGIAARCIRKISNALAIMSVNIYGMFFMAYGVSSTIVYFISVYVITRQSDMTIARLFTCITIAVVSIPLLASNKSVSELFGSGRLSYKIAVKYFRIPKEKLSPKEKLGGTGAMLVSALIGVILGALSFYVSPAVVLCIFLVFNVVFLIHAMPEIGVLLSVLAIPFMQYLAFSKLILISLILVTLISFIIKVLKGNRSFHISAPGLMVVLYCIATVISSSFSPMGAAPFFNSLVSSVVVIGGYFLGSNLTRKQNIRDIAIKTLTVSLVVIAILQFWNMYYMSISSGIEYSLNFEYRSIISNAGFEPTYNIRLPGLLASMLSPLLIAQCFKQKRVYNVVALMLCFIPVVLSIAFYGTFEVMLALFFGIALYLVLYSHKTLTAIILLTVPFAIAAMLLPFALRFFGIESIPTFSEAVDLIFPNNGEVWGERSSVIKDAWAMIRDGHMSGIGVGEDVFLRMLAPYASITSENASDAGTMYIQVICESGMLGFLIFFSFVFLLCRDSFKYVMRGSDKNERNVTLALLCGFVTAVLLGSVSCIYSDLQMKFLFWLCAGMLQCQAARGRENEKRIDACMEYGAYNTDISIRI